MAYELINAELNIWTCSVEDLSDQLIEFVIDQGQEYWTEGVSFESLAVFFEPVQKRIILNRNHPNFSIHMALCEVYMLLDGEEEREELISEISPVPQCLQDTIAILNTAIKERGMRHQWLS